MGSAITDKLSNDAISKEGGTIKKNDLDINHLAHPIRVFFKRKDTRIFRMSSEKKVTYW
uniref:Uncharacterized protein n=1 Tax=Yersinia enterocolitica W22703 TaxID=913028 RepID=F4MXG9_YEREN|nr:unknown protein [Yersinia enterocolitica W22703]